MKITKENLIELEKLPGLLESNGLDVAAVSEPVEALLGADAVAKKVVTQLLKEDLTLDYTPNENQKDLWQKVQDEALNLYGDWNKEAASLAVASFISGGGQFVNQTEEVISINETFPGFTAAQEFNFVGTYKNLKELSDDSFVGENRTYPVVNLGLAKMALTKKENLDSTKINLIEKYGLEKDGKVFLAFAGDLRFYLGENEKPEDILASLPLNEDELEQANKFIEELSQKEHSLEEGAKPVELSKETLIKMLKEKEDLKNDSSLSALVGLTRTLGVTKEQLNKVSNAYSIFTRGVLEKLLQNIPEKAEETNKSNPSISNNGEKIPTPIEVVNDPIIKHSGNKEAVRVSWKDAGKF